MSSIVVVNDEPNVLMFIRTFLEEDGHSVRAFAHAPEALAALQTEAADLVITDGTNWPINGIEFVRRLRSFSGVPIIFVSAWADELEEKLRGTKLEAYDYVQVPFARDDFVARVRQGRTPDGRDLGLGSRRPGRPRRGRGAQL